MLEVGERAPQFRALCTDGQTRGLADFAGRWLVIYFFPKAFTPGCTAETRRFRDNHGELRELGAEVLGISHDDHETQCDFARATAASFPLIADESRELSRAFGAGRSFLPFDRRLTFVIDPGGIIRAVFHHEFQVSKHLDDVVRFLRHARG